ncbi:hypothetical protein GCM10027024_00060 [Microbacterium insulae]
MVLHQAEELARGAMLAQVVRDDLHDDDSLEGARDAGVSTRWILRALTEYEQRRGLSEY